MTHPSYEASLSSTCAIPEETHRASLRQPWLTQTGCTHGASAGHATHGLRAPACMTHLTGLDEKKALNLEDTRADTFGKSG